MRDCFFAATMTVGVVVAAAGVSASVDPAAAQAQSVSAAASGPLPKTAWGEPDLQGIWTEQFDSPFQRPAKYGNQEYFTEAQREELNKQRGALYGSDPRQERGTAVDVGGAYNTAFLTVKHAGARTSLVVDPPNGRIPSLTPSPNRADTGSHLDVLRPESGPGVAAQHRHEREPALAGQHP